MVLWIILAAVIIPVICFLILRIKIGIEYSEGKLEVVFNAGLIKIKLYPSEDKDGKRKKKKEKTAAKDGAAAGQLGQLREFLSILSDISEKVKKRFAVDDLILYYGAADEDAAKAAMKFGYANVLAGAVLPILDNSFKVRNKDIKTAVSFTERESYIYFKLRLSLAMRILPYIVIVFGYKYKYMKLRKENESHPGVSRKASE